MRHSFPFGAFLPYIVISLFQVIAPSTTLAQSSAALSNVPATRSALAQKIVPAGVPNAGKISFVRKSLRHSIPIPDSLLCEALL
jgi:GTP1/Obg family GTP-binding protein